jgi:hypothetical protein
MGAKKRGKAEEIIPKLREAARQTCAPGEPAPVDDACEAGLPGGFRAKGLPGAGSTEFAEYAVGRVIRGRSMRF